MKKYNVKEIAALEGVALSTVYGWIADGFLPALRRPSKKGRGAIVITEEGYRHFKESFREA